MSSPVISTERMLNNSNVSVVIVNWTPTVGNYDLSHYTVELFCNSILISSRLVSSGNSTVFFVPVNGEVQARITTTSECNVTSNGVFTDPITIRNGSKLTMCISALSLGWA